MSINVLTSTIAIASLSYVQPVFQANYVEIQVTAQVTMPDVLSVDIVTPTDLVALTVDKSLQDATNGTTDVVAKGIAKPVADTINTPTDSLKRFFNKKLTEIQSVAEAKSISFGKALADTTSVQDLAALSTVKTLADSVAQPVDSVANVVYKALSDSFSFTDATQATLIFIRQFSESLDTLDAYSEEFIAPHSETTTTSDFRYASVTKNLAEGLNAIDNMDGDLTYAFVKVVGELLISSDSQVIDFLANKADNVSTSSSGVLSMQDYCDITYFLEDYVGLSRTFT